MLDDDLDEADEFMIYLVENEGLLPTFLPDGEVVYRPGPRLAELCPELADEMDKALAEDLLSLMDKGHVEMDIDVDLNPVFSLTDLGKEYVDQLTEEE